MKSQSLFFPPLFVLLGWIVGFAPSCSVVKSAPKHEVVRDIHAAFNEDGSYLLIAESRYRTNQPEQPYFNASAARNWKINLYEIGPFARPVQKSDLDSTNPQRRLIGGWDEEAEPGGSLMTGPLYWLRGSGRLVGIENQQPFMFDIAGNKRYELRPPEKTIVALVGAELAEGAFGRSPTPSPDGKWIAVFFTAPYQPGGGLQAIQFKHFVAFFAMADGRYIGSRAVAWPDKSVDPALTPHVPGLPLRYQFLWNKNSAEVFVLSRAQALRVPRDESGSIQKAGDVPARAVPTIGGPVSPGGQFVFLQENHSAPNQRRLGLQQLSGWLDFQKIPAAKHAEIRYSVP